MTRATINISDREHVVADAVRAAVLAFADEHGITMPNRRRLSRNLERAAWRELISEACTFRRWIRRQRDWQDVAHVPVWLIDAVMALPPVRR